MKEKGKIFLIDDDSIIVSMLSRALKSEGYEVRGESSQFEGVVETVIVDIAENDISDSVAAPDG